MNYSESSRIDRLIVETRDESRRVRARALADRRDSEVRAEHDVPRANAIAAEYNQMILDIINNRDAADDLVSQCQELVYQYVATGRFQYDYNYHSRILGTGGQCTMGAIDREHVRLVEYSDFMIFELSAVCTNAPENQLNARILIPIVPNARVDESVNVMSRDITLVYGIELRGPARSAHSIRIYIVVVGGPERHSRSPTL